MNTPSSQNPQFSTNGMLGSNNGGTPTVRAWRLILLLLQALQADALYLWNFIMGAVIYNYIATAGATITLTPIMFNGGNVIGSTDATGTTTFNLPNPAATPVGLALRLQTVGGNLIKLVPTVGTQTLDGAVLGAGGKIINSPDYPSGNLTPPQTYGIYSDGTNWHTSQNS